MLLLLNDGCLICWLHCRCSSIGWLWCKRLTNCMAHRCLAGLVWLPAFMQAPLNLALSLTMVLLWASFNQPIPAHNPKMCDYLNLNVICSADYIHLILWGSLPIDHHWQVQLEINMPSAEAPDLLMAYPTCKKSSRILSPEHSFMPLICRRPWRTL